MGDFIRVHCRHCDQTYLTTVTNPSEGELPGQCDLCRKPGGLVSYGAPAREEQRLQMRETPPPMPSSMSDSPRAFQAGPLPEYLQVPWYRRSATVSTFVLVGFFCLPPLLWAACIICLTGQVYNNRIKKDGTLSRWSSGNKVAAVIILAIQAVAIIFRLIILLAL